MDKETQKRTRLDCSLDTNQKTPIDKIALLSIQIPFEPASRGFNWRNRKGSKRLVNKSQVRSGIILIAAQMVK